MKVLVISDHDKLNSLVHEMLAPEGYRVWTGGGVEQGYSDYLMFAPEVVIADLELRRKNAVELRAGRIRAARSRTTR